MTDEPRLVTVYREAYSILRQYELTDKGWTFDFSNEKGTLGRCHYNERLITFSQYYLDIQPEEITGTLLHEVAHALVGPTHGHDDLWRTIAAGIGARPQRCAPVGVKSSATPNYKIACSVCNWYVQRYRLRKRVGELCPQCSSPVKYFRYVKEV